MSQSHEAQTKYDPGRAHRLQPPAALLCQGHHRQLDGGVWRVAELLVRHPPAPVLPNLIYLLQAIDGPAGAAVQGHAEERQEQGRKHCQVEVQKKYFWTLFSKYN